MLNLLLITPWLPMIVGISLFIALYGYALFAQAKGIEHVGKTRLSQYGSIWRSLGHTPKQFSQILTWMQESTVYKKLGNLLEDADLSWSIVTIVLIFLGLFSVILVLSIVIFWLRFPLNVGFSAIGSIGLFLYYLKERGGARERALQAQTPEIALLLSNGLRAGLTLYQAMHEVAAKLANPAKSEFHKLLQQIDLGKPMEDTLHDFLNRHPGESMRILLSALLIQRETGGDLVKTLSTISTAVFKRQRVVEEVLMITTEARRNSLIMIILPLVVLGVLNLMTGGMVSILINETAWGFPFFVIVYVFPQVIAQYLIRKVCDVKV